MIRDAEATRTRLLAAARREFAAFGIAGARVDRIAAEAASNKAQIYHYFGSKDQLFDAVFAAVVDEHVRENPVDVDDLPGYAARVAKSYEQRPDVVRLVTWQRLERGESPTVAVEAGKATIVQIAQAQADGRVSDRYPADVLLHAVLHIAALWAATSPDMTWARKPPSAAARRRIVTQMVHDLLAA